MTLQESLPLVQGLDEAVRRYGLSDTMNIAALPASKRRRRGFDAESFSGLARLSLVETEGRLSWVYEPPLAPSRPLRARRASVGPIGASVISSFPFKEAPPNQSIKALQILDQRLTPDQGLREITGGKLIAYDGRPIAGKTLLFLHGTFSKSDMFVDELASIVPGRQFLAHAAAKYEAVLAFDHPTLSVSPWINALDLEVALKAVRGPIDVVAHSRGGLVALWWLRVAGRRGKVVLAGSPLNGTSLASPARLRAALDALANIFRALQLAGAAASTVVPMMGAVAGLARIFGGVLRLGAGTPLIDAGISLVPGLSAQSMVSNNAEIDRLNQTVWPAPGPSLYAIASNFSPAESDAHWWQLWKHLQGQAIRLGDAAVDRIFEGPNDLVVDCVSMSSFGGTPFVIGHDFGASPVHHCNYFRQAATAEFLKRTLP